MNIKTKGGKVQYKYINTFKQYERDYYFIMLIAIDIQLPVFVSISI